MKKNISVSLSAELGADLKRKAAWFGISTSALVSFYLMQGSRYAQDAEVWAWIDRTGQRKGRL